MENVSKFLKDFQDMYVERTSDLYTDSHGLNNLELKAIDRYLERLNEDITTLVDLDSAAAKEAKNHYLNLLRILEEKIDYIGDTADVYNYVNSYFDMRTLKDIYNYNLRESYSDSCIYDKNKKGITLKSLNSLYRCPKTIENSTVTFYNTNKTYHTGINITSKYLDVLIIDEIIIRKTDGTILELDPSTFQDFSYYIAHESLESSQITLTLSNTLPTTTAAMYLDSIELNLIDYTYHIEGNLPLAQCSLESSDLLTIVADVVQETNTYSSINLGLEIIDINNQVLDTSNISIPLNGSLVCKRLDKINFNEVDVVEALLIKGRRTNSNTSIDYLKTLTFPNEKYVLYKPKDLLENKVNRYITKLGNTSFRINSRIVKKINLSPTLELYSFNEKSSPIVKYLTGVTKNETI